MRTQIIAVEEDELNDAIEQGLELSLPTPLGNGDSTPRKSDVNLRTPDSSSENSARTLTLNETK